MAIFTAKYKPYLDYKDSGVEWLGGMPAHWNVRRLKHLLRSRKGAIKTGPFGSQLKITEMMAGEIKVYNQRSVIDGDFAIGQNYISLEKFDELRAFEVFPNDVLITTRGTIGLCAVVPVDSERGILHPCLMRMQFDRRLIHIHFIELLIQDSNCVLDQLELKSNATTIDVIYSESLREVWLAVPPLPEQRAIAGFLDRETAKIDSLVAKKERLIELLQEKRTALISRAVTKGLDPDVPMKDSGVEWLGEMPAHWEVKRLRATVLGCQNGVWGAEPNGSNDIACVRVADFDRVKFRANTSRPTLRSIEADVIRTRMLYPGDLLLEVSGGGEKQPVGTVVMYDDKQPAVCSNFIAQLRPSEGFESRYLTYLHSTLYSARVNVRSVKQSIGIQNLHKASYLNEAAGFPPLPEQQAIAGFLDRETAKIDGLVSKIHEAIDRLKELRTAFISAAVTGKIDVREEVE